MNGRLPGEGKSTGLGGGWRRRGSGDSVVRAHALSLQKILKSPHTHRSQKRKKRKKRGRKYLVTFLLVTERAGLLFRAVCIKGEGKGII